METVAIFVLLLGFLTTYMIIPKLIGIVKFKKLMDHPDKRSSHVEKTPTLGGIAFYISLIFGLFAIHFFEYDGYALNIVVGMTILFFVGLKDDLMVLSAQIKLSAELIAASFVLMIPDLWITSFNGLFGIHEIPAYAGIILSYFIMVFVINAYNLIDGIDGLSGMLGTLIFIIFGSIFYLTGLSLYFLLSVLAIGFLIAFLRFNVSDKNKIFMGDTGSLIVGFLIAIITIRFLAMKEIEFQQVFINPPNKFIIAMSILFFPIMDVGRVIVMRLLNNRGPFDPDRCHMHHIMVDKGLKHFKTSLTMTVCSLMVFLVIFISNTVLSVFGVIVVFIVLSIVTFSILLVLDSNEFASNYRKRFKALFPRSLQLREFKARKVIITYLKKVFYKDLM